METIYIKRIIKSEADLPKQDGSYIVAAGNERAEEFFFPDNPYDVKNWLNNIDWYLQPVTLAELTSGLRERIKLLEFMIDKGLGWEDMRNDITMPHEL